MRILMIVKYLPIQGGVSIQNYWLAQTLAELGHDVVVLTNADEVEDEYRIHLNEDDTSKLAGFRKTNSIRVVSTTFDPNEFYIPFSQPFSSKLLSLGLEIVQDFQPDFIYAHYVEPYGVVAMNLSALTGVPYTIKHAGSDLGKLSKLPQLKSLHEIVYRNAMLVASQGKHRSYFQGIGVPEEKMTVLGFKPWPADVFRTTGAPVSDGVCKLLIYGKTGRTKGTDQLLDALDAYDVQKPRIKVSAYWGGKHFDRYLEKITSLQLIERGLLDLHPYVPHWKIARAISESHAVLYLENNFKISIHGPGIPFEVLGSGRRLITTEEIADKYPQIIDETTSEVIKGTPMQIEDLLATISKVAEDKTLQTAVDSDVDLEMLYFNGVRNVERFLGRVQENLR
jgi:hypothetical protein